MKNKTEEVNEKNVESSSYGKGLRAGFSRK
jgi:hypothetical protein